MTFGKRKSRQDRQKRLALNLLFTAVIFCYFVLTMLIVAAVAFILVRQGILTIGPARPDTGRLLLYIAVTSILLGGILSWVVGAIPLRPVNQVISAMNRLADGEFRTRLEFGKWLSRHPTMRELKESFNKMADELENTEVLRSDFINNFSHEFKTPIVSIAGFASLLKRGNLTEDQKREYVDVIEEESLRLSAMATNVLNLSRVENQTILRDVTEFDLSEQIRSCVLLLESKWTKKNLDMILDFEEYTVKGSEELLKEAWINLIDNAVKFSPEYGEVRIGIGQREGLLSVAVSNAGSMIPQDKEQRIFQKFYQADESHATEGNGIGLAIVKKVVELHKGQILVDSEENKTTFTVLLPA